MTRTVVVTEEFLDRLDMLLPSRGLVEGAPTAQDFLIHELPAIVSLLAEDYEKCTSVRDGAREVRLFTFKSPLVGFMTLHTALSADGVVEIHWPTVHGPSKI